LAVGKKVWKILKRKTALSSAEKIILSKAEDKLVLRIPPVVRIGPIIVQPQTVFVAFQVKDVRIAARVSYVRHAIIITARLIFTRGWGCILFGSKTPPA